MGGSPLTEVYSQNNLKESWKQGAYKSKSGKWLNSGALTAFDQKEVKKNHTKGRS